MKFAKAGILYTGNVGRLRLPFPRCLCDLPSHLADSVKSDGCKISERNLKRKGAK